MHTYYFKDIDNYKIDFKHSIHERPSSVIGSLLISLRKKKLTNKIDILYSKHEIRHCAFCGNIMSPHQFYFDFIADDNTITLISAGAKKDKYDKKYMCCDNKNCSRIGLNPNSIEFITKAYSISETEARNIIHSRNKSPFYSINHSCNNEYLHYQGHSDFTLEQRNSTQRLDTYYSNKNEYINEYGLDAWFSITSNKDSSSLAYFIKKNNGNELLAQEEFRIKNEATKSKGRPYKDSSLEEKESWMISFYLNTLDIQEFKHSCIDKIKNYGIMGKILCINRFNESITDVGQTMSSLHYFMWLGSEIFNISDFYEFLNIPNSIVSIAKVFNTKMYAYSTVYDGYFFRSDMELTFYLKLKTINNIKIIDINKRYNNSSKVYDFKIEYKNNFYYIELCSNIDTEYINNQIYKQNKFGSLCILPKFINKFIECIKTNSDIDKGAYYEYN